MAHGSPWIAIVDDDPSVLKSLSRTLRVRGFETRTFSSAREFLTALPAGTPSCLIVDVQMPGITGPELIHHLTGAGIHLPTIVISAHSDIRMPAGPEVTGVVAILSKPLRNEALFDAIGTAIGRSGASQP